MATTARLAHHRCNTTQRHRPAPAAPNERCRRSRSTRPKGELAVARVVIRIEFQPCGDASSGPQIVVEYVPISRCHDPRLMDKANGTGRAGTPPADFLPKMFIFIVL